MSSRERGSPRFRNSGGFHKSSFSLKDRDNSYRRHLIDRRYPPYRRGRERQLNKVDDPITKSSYRGKSPSLDHKGKYPTSIKIRSPTSFSDEDRLSLLSGKGSDTLRRRSPDRWLRSISKISSDSIRRGSKSPVNFSRSELGSITIRNRSYSPFRSRSRSFDKSSYRRINSRLSRRSNSPTYKDRHKSKRSSLRSNTPRKRTKSRDRREHSSPRKTSIKSSSTYSKRRKYGKEDSLIEVSSTEALSRLSIQRQIQHELKRRDLLERKVRLRDRKRSESSIERFLNDCKNSVENKTVEERDIPNIQDPSEDVHEHSNSPVHRPRKFKGLSQITIERGKSLEKSISPVDCTKDIDLATDLNDTIKTKSNVDEVCSQKACVQIKDVPLNHSNFSKDESSLENDNKKTLDLSKVNFEKDHHDKSPTNRLELSLSVNLEKDRPANQLLTSAIELSPISQAGSSGKESPERLALSPISLQDNFEQVDLLERQEIEARNKANLSPFSQEGSFKDYEVHEKVSLSPISQAESFDHCSNKNSAEIKNPLIERPKSTDSMQEFLAELERSCERELSPFNERTLSSIPDNKKKSAHFRERKQSPSVKVDKFKDRDIRYKSKTKIKYDTLFSEKSTAYKMSADNHYQSRYQVSSKDQYLNDDSNQYRHMVRLSASDRKRPVESAMFSSRSLHNSISEQTFDSSYDRYRDNLLFERRGDKSLDQPRFKYSIQDPISQHNIKSQAPHHYSTSGFQADDLGVRPHSKRQSHYSNISEQRTIQPHFNLLNMNLPLSNNNTLTPEELAGIFKDFVIYFGVQKNSYLEKDPCVVIQESFSRSDTFGRLISCFLDDESGPELIKETVCQLQWRGYVLCRGQASLKSTAERKASINLINTLAHYCYTVQMKYYYFCGGDLPSFMVRDEELADVFKLVKKSDIISSSSPQVTSQYGVNHSDVAPILNYIDNFFKADTYCELLFGGSDLNEFTWLEMQKIIKHVLDKSFLEYRMLNGTNKGKYIAISRRHTPQEICQYLLNYRGEHLRFRLLPPLPPHVNILTEDGKINPAAMKSTKPGPVSNVQLIHYGGNYIQNPAMMYSQPGVQMTPSMVQPLPSYSQPNVQPMPYGNFNPNPTGMYGPPGVQMQPLIPMAQPMLYGESFNPNVAAGYGLPVPQMPPMVQLPMNQQPKTKQQAKAPPNRVLRSIDVIEID